MWMLQVLHYWIRAKLELIYVKHDGAELLGDSAKLQARFLDRSTGGLGKSLVQRKYHTRSTGNIHVAIVGDVPYLASIGLNNLWAHCALWTSSEVVKRQLVSPICFARTLGKHIC